MNKKAFTLIKSKGFTLIELLVVVSLIGILATLVVANMNSARERARDAQRKSDLRNIQTALRLYYNDNAGYPAGNGSITGCTGSCVWGEAWVKNNVTYMNILPGDPLATQAYTYTSADSEDYSLKACLENASDDKCVDVAESVCASTCQYTVKP